MPAVEVTLTITPDPRSRIAGRNAWIMRSEPYRFVSNMRRTSDRGVVSIAPSTPKPALFTSTSTGPGRASAAATEAALETSRARVDATLRSSSVSGRRAVATTSYPRAVSSVAVARPIPVEHPVTIARLFAMRGPYPALR
jgi:hypothetical protein